MPKLVVSSWLLVIVLFLPLPLLGQVQVTVSGRVTDELENPVAAAKMILMPQKPGQPIETQTGADGSFSINRDISSAGLYKLTVRADGFYELKKPEPINIVVGLNIINIKLIHQEGPSDSVAVTGNIYSNKHLEIEQIEMSQPLSAEQVDSVPVSRATKLENIVAALPGLVKDQRGELHVQGSPSDQTNWLLDGFNISDPNTGKLGAKIGVETVGGLNVFTSRYSVEYGPGSGGTLAIDTKSPTNVFRHHLTDFFPGIRNIKGLAIDSWGPKANLSGPIKKDRVWFFTGLNSDYKSKVFLELPDGQDRSINWQAGGVTRLQFALNTKHFVNAGFLYNYFHEPFGNLSPLDPIETTLKRQSHQNFFYLKDQYFPSSKTMFEFGYARYRSDDYETPRGEKTYQFFNGGRRGNAPHNFSRKGNRDEFLVNALLPTLDDHQLKAGLNIQRSLYGQNAKRNIIEHFRLDDTLSLRISYAGNGRFQQSHAESSLYLQDRWTMPKKWILVEAGLRWDYDSFLAKGTVTPRVSAAIVPPWLWFKNRTKFAFGYGLIPEKANLRLFTRGLDQYSIFEKFEKDGKTTSGNLSVNAFRLPAAGQLIIPRVVNASFSVEQNLPKEVFLQLNYLRKQLRKGYAFLPKESGSETTGATIFELQNGKRESYNSIELAASKKFFNKYDWFGSYTWSESKSNAAGDISVDDPILHTRVSGTPTAWDSPHRLVSWGLFPLDSKKRRKISYFLEMRDGFPYSVYNDEGNQIGETNSNRFPRYFTLNLTYSHQFKFRIMKYQPQLMLGVENITSHPNAGIVNQNISSPLFGTLLGLEPRRFFFRIRFLGKQD